MHRCYLATLQIRPLLFTELKRNVPARQKTRIFDNINTGLTFVLRSLLNNDVDRIWYEDIMTLSRYCLEE